LRQGGCRVNVRVNSDLYLVNIADINRNTLHGGVFA
jgi:hypothetical protein